MKKCKQCREVKFLGDFYSNKMSKDGIDYICKSCSSDNCKERRRSLYGKAEHIYSRQKQSSKDRHHKKPSYSRDEFIDWILNNKDYLRLHDEWVKSGYKKSLAPSVDRLDDYKGYSFDNIQIVTWEENLSKSFSDRKNGINNKSNKAVIKMDLNGVELETYHSINQAGRKMGIYYQNIWKACNGLYTQSGGFRWKYSDEDDL